MNAITATREIEFVSAEFPAITLEVTAIYIPQDDEWLLTPQADYLQVIEAQCNIYRQQLIRYVDNKLLDMGMDCEPQKWAAEDEKLHEAAEAEATMQEIFDRR